MRERLREALCRSTADYAEIRFEEEDGSHIAFRGPEAEAVGSHRFRGGMVRACTRGGWGEATFDAVEELDERVAQACACAAEVGQDETALAPVDPVDAEAPARLEHDFRGVPLDEKLKQVVAYNELILGADPRIASSGVSYTDAFRRVHYANSEGASFLEERPRLVLRATAVAREDRLVQYATESVSSAKTYDCVLGLEERVAAAARRAVDLLDAPSCPGGAQTVVLDPELAGVFAHEAFGHLSEADHLYENERMREVMTLGRELGCRELNIVDDGSLPGRLGSAVFDDEGVPTGKTDLIRDGVLAGRLHNRETAARMGEAPTGNARAIRRNVPPLVRMTNTYVEGGDLSFAEMIRGIDDGIYALGMLGGQTMMEQFTFSAAYGYRIRKGEVGGLVRDVTLTGNVFETLKRMDGFGDDFRIVERAGGCGKGGQSPLPVTFGAPHLRIRDVVVGGR